MQIQNRIEKGFKTDKEIQFILAASSECLQGVPAGKMITDSDELSFVYLFDQEVGYGHVHFTQSVWPLMVELLKNDLEPILSFGEELISLPGFKEELEMLIYNIEGNDNYGEAFSSAVELAFSAILQSVE